MDWQNKIQQAAASRQGACMAFAAQFHIFSWGLISPRALAGAGFSNLFMLPAFAGAVGARFAAALLATMAARGGFRAAGSGRDAQPPPPPATKIRLSIPHAALTPRLLPIPAPARRG